MNWRPTASPQTLERRSQVLQNVRAFFYEREFIEVQTPVLGRDTVVDRHIDPVRVKGDQLGVTSTNGKEYFLQTSPEFCMKRIVANATPAIFQICPAFRAGERGELHNTEFTMVEWYRVGDDMEAGVKLLAELAQRTLGQAARLSTYRDAFQNSIQVDPFECDLQQLAEVGAGHLDVDLDWSSDRDDWLNLLFAELVQPGLGKSGPEIVTHYPASQSALARIDSEDSRAAERFELFCGGIELANGYHELLDAGELTHRNESVNRQRIADGKEVLPEQSRLLEAMQSGLPACAGCALGFDRLMMVILGVANIADVISFPIERS